MAGSDAIVFAAGAGPGSGPARKLTVDYGGAVAPAEAAIAMGSKPLSDGERDRRQPSGALVKGDGAVLRRQGEADKFLEESGLDYTIMRPGG